MKQRILSRERPADSDLYVTKRPKLPWLYCDCRYISIWLLIVVLLSTALGLIVYFLVIAKEPYKGPPFLPDNIRPISYNVTLRLYTTIDNERSDYDGAVTIELVCVNSTDQVNIHKGDNLQFDRVLLSSTDSTKAPSVDSVRHDSQTDITTIQLNGYLMPSRTYLLQIVSFTGQMSKDQSNQGLILYQYSTSLNQTRYGATFASDGGGLRHVFPSFDSAAFPAIFNFVIARTATLRSLTNAKRDITVKENEQILDDNFAATPVFAPTDIAIVICDFQYIRFQQIGIQVDVFSRPEILSNISASASRMVQYADSRSSDMGKLEAVVVPGLRTRFDKPGLSLIPENQALDDAARIAGR